uniref:Retrotransposon Copia-like N-terminal domain-containing protein n=1 Tax=Cannabis sativa TaxID=3483 RepID=A0A803NLS7_CANSA
MSTGDQTPHNQASTGGARTTASNIATATNVASASNAPTPSAPFGSTLTQPFALKLDRNNYTLWRTMVFTIVRGHRLDGYLTGARSRPPETIPSVLDSDENVGFGVQTNPNFEQWIIHDQLLLGWLYGSMTEEIPTKVMGSESSVALWSALQALYGAHSKAKMDEYRTKIQTA